jgi:hypothetical protein
MDFELYYFGVEKHFSTHACLFYKTEHENKKEAAKLFYSFQKQCFH